MQKHAYIFSIVLFTQFYVILGSTGDRSPFYQQCVKKCISVNCTEDGSSYASKAAEKQDKWSYPLQWKCSDECRYHCMWRTVQAFQARNTETPKFHGKWPFKRIFGVQEPASAFSSILNLAAQVYMHCDIITRFSIKETPLVLFWHIFVVVCTHGWMWSTIFHIRDTPFTEFMDYSCALSMVIALFVAAIIRVFHKKRKLTALMLILTLLYYIEHVKYLHSGSIDYEYNMAVNVTFGVAGSVVWLFWSFYQYLSGRRYVWRLIVFILLSGAALTLELFDFPPVYNAWDAHALWHLSTAPLPLLFYRFVIDDLYYLQTPWGREKMDSKLT